MTQQVTQLDDLELEMITSAAVGLAPDRRVMLLRRVAAALAHTAMCEEGAVQRAIALTWQCMAAA